MVLLAAVASFGLQKSLSPAASAEADPSLAPTAPSSDALMPQLVSGPPTSTTKTDIAPDNAILTWTPTGTNGQQDTYEVQIADSLDPATGQPVDSISHSKLTVASYDARPLNEGTYYWKVRSCGQITCGDWSSMSTLNVDATAPVAPTAKLTSNQYDQNASFAGTAEAGSVIAVKVAGATTCTTTVAPDGTWSCEATPSLDYGDYTASVTATDTAGNVSPETALDFSVKELFVAPQITQAELPATLEVVTIDSQSENKVLDQPMSSADAVSMGASKSADSTTRSQPTTPLSTDGGLLQSSQAGWQVLGLPWFMWVGGMTGIGGAWWAFGIPVPRRLGSILSL
jgi:hypothetical protein